MPTSEIHAPFWNHVNDLRQTLIRCLVAIIVGIAFAFLFYQQIFTLLIHPLEHSLKKPLPVHENFLTIKKLHQERIANTGKAPILYTFSEASEAITVYYTSPGTIKIHENAFQIPSGGFLDLTRPEPQVNDKSLMIFGPLEGFKAVLTLCFWVGFVGSSPIWMYFILQFISPALHSHEKRLILPFFFLSLGFLSIGFLFAYWITIPMANHYLYTFNEGIGTNLWSLAQYLDYSVMLLLANGLVFELAVLALFLVKLHILTAQMMIAHRRSMIVAAFIVGALLTPPDVFTQFLLAIPLIILYEAVILYAKLAQRRALRDSI